MIDLSTKISYASTNDWLVVTLTSEDALDTFSWYLYYGRFKITQYTNGFVTAVINPIDSLYYETGSATTQDY